jgi:hypothetical protein
MAELEILGAHTGLQRGDPKTWLIIGGSALALLLIFRRKPGGAAPTASGGGGISGSQQLEFARLAQQAQSDMARLTSTNNLRLSEIQLQSPMALSTEVPFSAFDRLSKGVRDLLLGQVRGGEAVVTPTRTGLRFTPTGQGIAGHQPAPPQPRRQRSIGVNIPGLGGGNISF